MSNVLTCSAVLHTIRVLAHNGPVRIDLARWQGRLVVTKRVLGIAPDVASRLGREAEVAGRLRHDNIVPLLAVKGDVLVYAYCPGVRSEERRVGKECGCRSVGGGRRGSESTAG